MTAKVWPYWLLTKLQITVSVVNFLKPLIPTEFLLCNLADRWTLFYYRKNVAVDCSTSVFCVTRFLRTDLETYVNVKLFLIYHIPCELFLFVANWIHGLPLLTSYDTRGFVGTYKWTSGCIFFKFSFLCDGLNYENSLLNHIPYSKSNKFRP
jgi:hypothetical protein